MLKRRRDVDLRPRHTGFEYQVQAVDSLWNLPHAAVFHEQGLGKTKIGLDIGLKWLASGVCDSVLIVSKKGLLENWRCEMSVHTRTSPGLLTQDRKANFFAFNRPSAFYLTHYEVLCSERSRFSLFLNTRNVGIILDESHYFKNPETKVSKALFSLSPQFTRKLIMTGTPVANRPYDVWSQIYFLDAGVSLGDDFELFKKENDLKKDEVDSNGVAIYEKDSNVQAEMPSFAGIFAKISDFAVRETKATSGIELPGKTVVDIPVNMSSPQRKLYLQYRDDLRAEVARDGAIVEDDVENILKRLLRLIQVASNPALIDESWMGEPGKVPVLRDIVSEQILAGGKIIVWTNFLANVPWLKGLFEELNPASVSGDDPVSHRVESIERFKRNSECSMLVATPGAAKEGLTLTVSNRAVFYDRTFSLDDYIQAQDRIHRISQTQECFVHNLLCVDTVDEWIGDLLAAKDLAAKLTQGDIDVDEYSRHGMNSFAETLNNILGDGK